KNLNQVDRTQDGGREDKEQEGSLSINALSRFVDIGEKFTDLIAKLGLNKAGPFNNLKNYHDTKLSAIYQKLPVIIPQLSIFQHIKNKVFNIIYLNKKSFAASHGLYKNATSHGNVKTTSHGGVFSSSGVGQILFLNRFVEALFVASHDLGASTSSIEKAVYEDGGEKLFCEFNNDFSITIMKNLLYKQGIKEKDHMDIIAKYQNVEELEGRIIQILNVIKEIETANHILDIGMPESSKKAILKTYLNEGKSKIFLETVVQRPLRDNFIDNKKAEEWLKAHSVELQELAKFILNHSTYFNEEEFEDEVDKSLKEFRYNLRGRSYIILKKKEGRSSNDWVYELVREKGVSPAALVEVGRFKNVECVKELIEEKGVCDLVVIDDAAFSGYQASGTIVNFLDGLIKENIEHKDFNVHMVIPFMTIDAEKRIKKLSNRVGKLYIYKQQTIAVVSDIFKENIRKYPDKKAHFDSLCEFMDKVYLYNNPRFKCLTYFQHKIANGLSLIASLTKEMIESRKYEGTTVFHGVVVNEDGKKIKFMPFIPKTIPPYVQDYLKLIRMEIIKEKSMNDGGSEGFELKIFEYGYYLINKKDG
ncbi:MAG: hypothetical protein KAI91_05175, partial [Candidatus Omnitrophica bacterium]|nr:hypothetical protein [Candidatus Omnitrophota bacterium]